MPSATAACRFKIGMRASHLAILITCLQLLPTRVLAGGGPENVLVVVNGDSAVSMQIANTYVSLRDIPSEHVLWLHDIPYRERISIDTFRTHIWKPIREFITRNRLDNEIDIITYSSGFPHAVNFSSDLKTNKLPRLKYHGKTASLTGLTYFARHVEKGSPYYLAGNANRYFRRSLAPARQLPRPATEEETVKQRQAEKDFRKKDYQSALASYEALVQGFPEHGGLWHELARSHAAVGNTAEAMAALRQAVDHGWTYSLKTRTDPHLSTLSADPAWPRMLDLMEQGNGPFQEAHGFSAQYEWTGATLPVKTIGSNSLDSYYLATMLAYTGIRGNSVPEVESYLEAARDSDGSQPDGTVYLMANNNVRSTTRQPLFIETVTELEHRGHRAEILTRRQAKQDGILPQGKPDVIGAVIGARKFQWEPTGSRLLPGAIAESLTSYGARFGEHSQTKLTEFLRHGAAGSSGAVAEPFSIQAKFPVPLLHVYYADGCSLAEAFYQSLEAPYQLLVVGDPLARPYARFADVTLASPDPHTPWSGTVRLYPKVRPAPDRPIAQLELWVDGKLIAYSQPDQPFTWDTRSMDDGHHELRLVTQESGPIETRSYTRLGVLIANSGHQLALKSPDEIVRYGQTITINGTALEGREATLWQGSRKLANAPVIDGEWEVEIDSQQLGIGPVILGVHVSFDDQKVVRSAPIKLTITPPRFVEKKPPIDKPAQEDDPTDTLHPGNKTRTLDRDGYLSRYPDAQEFLMEGQIMIDRSGFYELVLSGEGDISLAVNTLPLLSNRRIDRKKPLFLPVALEKGAHEVKIKLSTMGKKPALRLVLEGDRVATVLNLNVAENIHKEAASPL